MNEIILSVALVAVLIGLYVRVRRLAAINRRLWTKIEDLEDDLDISFDLQEIADDHARRFERLFRQVAGDEADKLLQQDMEHAA